MDIVSAIIVYILLWWWVFFMTLPFGATPPKIIGTGHASSAPAQPHIGKKICFTTLIAAILFIIVYALITSSLFSFR